MNRNMVKMISADGKKTIDIKKEHVERKLAKGWKVKGDAKAKPSSGK